MVMVCNNKPVIGEIESKAEKRQRNILYFRVAVYCNKEKREIKSQNDIRVTLEATQIMRNSPVVL